MRDGPKIDDVIQNLVEQEAKKKGKKRVHSGRKGKTWERDLCKALSERFGMAFSRTPGSGGFATGGVMDEQARDMLTGDIIVPECFRFVLEAKKGYPVDLHNLWMLAGVPGKEWFRGGRRSDLKTIVGFVCQAMRDAERKGKDWMVMWRTDNRCPLGICSHSPRSAGFSPTVKLEWILRKEEWADVEGSSVLPDEMSIYLYPLADLLNLPDEFWIESNTDNRAPLIEGGEGS